MSMPWALNHVKQKLCTFLKVRCLFTFFTLKKFLQVCLPRRDCSVPSSVDAMSLSLSKPRPLSIHDWAVFSKTYNLHCIWSNKEWQQTRAVLISATFIYCMCGIKKFLPVKRCFLIPLQFSRRLSLRCTSWLWLWCKLLQTPPKTLTRCSLVR